MKEKHNGSLIFINRYQQKISTGKKKHSYIYIVIFGCIISLSLIVNVWSSKPPPLKPFKANISYDDYPDYDLTIETTETSSMETFSPPDEEDKTVVIQDKIKRDDTLWDIFQKNGINTTLIYKIIKAARHTYNLNRLQKGEAYTIKLSEDKKFEELLLETKDERILRVKGDGDKIDVSIEPFEYETRLASINSTIDGSLFETVIGAGERSSLVLNLAEIFAWEIDFFLDIRKGDKFKVTFEKKYRDGDFAKYGKILGAEFINKGKKFTAILFKDPSGYEDYYTYNGRSLRKQFLKSPLRYTRISSGFTKKRFHPILKRYLPHLGIDYAAPYGTPIRSVGDGRVIWAKRKGANGNLVIIKHNHIYTTTYAHLSRYAGKIKRGLYVRQGQVIGYVGSTGRATGPHLDFHIKKYGRSVNPLTLKIPSARSVSRKYKEDFAIVRDRTVALLNELNKDVLIAEN